MRGRLDDALDRLARRDKLRRRTESQTAGPPTEVTELVEAVAAVVARHPELGITMGVEGVGDPVLLHFAVEDGMVQVTADHRVAKEDGEARRADFDIDGDAIDDPLAGAAKAYDHDTAMPGSYAWRPADPLTDELPPQQTPRHRAPSHAAHERDFGAADTHLFSDRQGATAPRQMPTPLKVEPEATELAAKRLAALLREDPSLLQPER